MDNARSLEVDDAEAGAGFSTCIQLLAWTPTAIDRNFKPGLPSTFTSACFLEMLPKPAQAPKKP